MSFWVEFGSNYSYYDLITYCRGDESVDDVSLPLINLDGAQMRLQISLDFKI